MRYEQEILEKIMYYDATGVMYSFPLYIYRTKDIVNRDALEAAVDCAMKCHPLFSCRLQQDAQGSYLETNSERPIIPDLSPDKEYYYGNETNHGYPWVVGIHDREIIYTGYHGLADGIGATIFMRTVLYYYFKEQGIKCDPGKAVTLEDITPEYLEKDTECTVRKNGTENIPSLYKPGELQPSVFPDDMLVDDPWNCAVHNFAINLTDIKERCVEYNVSQFAVLSTYIAQAICSVLPGTDNVVLMNIVADMRGVLDSITTHNCVMSIPIAISQSDLMNKSDELLCKMFRSQLDLGYNRDEALHNCYVNAQMEKQIGVSKEYLAGAAAQITNQFGFSLPVASVTYTHLTHTGLSSDMFELLDDVYIGHAGFKKEGKQAIVALNAVTTEQAVNLMIIDGTKGERIIKALNDRLTKARVSFDTAKLDKYKGIIYKK